MHQAYRCRVYRSYHLQYIISAPRVKGKLRRWGAGKRNKDFFIEISKFGLENFTGICYTYLV